MSVSGFRTPCAYIPCMKRYVEKLAERSCGEPAKGQAAA